MWFRLFLTLFVALILPTATMADEIVLVADPWPPFNNEIGSDQEGYIVDVARAVFEVAGHTVIYKNIPWKRAILGTRSGMYTGAIGASKTDAEGFVFPDEELARNVLSFYVRQDDEWEFKGPASLKTVSIGVVEGYDYRKWLNKYIQQHRGNIQRVQVITSEYPLRQNLRKLFYKRIDVVVGNESAIRYTAREMGILDKIKYAGYGVEPAYIYIAFSPNLPESPKLAQQLSQGINLLRRNGQLKEILDRYGILDWR